MKEIAFTAAATTQARKLSPQIWGRISTKLIGYAESGFGDVKRLKGRDGARLRVGDWRVIFIEEGARITVVAVGHRREIYD